MILSWNKSATPPDPSFAGPSRGLTDSEYNMDWETGDTSNPYCFRPIFPSSAVKRGCPQGRPTVAPR